MIHLQQVTTAQTVSIPRPGVVPDSGDWSLTLISGTTSKSVQGTSVAVITNGMVLTTTATFTGLEKGSYAYELKRGTTVVSSGLCMVAVASWGPEVTSFSETINIKQYNG